MDLKAIQPVYRNGKLIQPGESFETTPEDGATLVGEGKAREQKARKPIAKPARASDQNDPKE